MQAFVMLLTVSAGLIGPIGDPAGDMYWPGAPGTPAGGGFPDLISGDAVVDHGGGELRLEFTFADPVYPADDWAHVDSQLFGYIDIDLNVPVVPRGNSRTSALSGLESGLGIEAYVDLGLLVEGTAPVMSPDAQLIGGAFVGFDGVDVSVVIGLDALESVGAVGDQIALAAYFSDGLQLAADVFPNENGHVILPEPTSLAALGFGSIFVLRRRRW